MYHTPPAITTTTAPSQIRTVVTGSELVERANDSRRRLRDILRAHAQPRIEPGVARGRELGLDIRDEEQRFRRQRECAGDGAVALRRAFRPCGRVEVPVDERREVAGRTVPEQETLRRGA